jgi:hypothetical protein
MERSKERWTGGLRFTVLASSSAGNACLIETDGFGCEGCAALMNRTAPSGIGIGERVDGRFSAPGHTRPFHQLSPQSLFGKTPTSVLPSLHHRRPSGVAAPSKPEFCTGARSTVCESLSKWCEMPAALWPGSARMKSGMLAALGGRVRVARLKFGAVRRAGACAGAEAAARPARLSALAVGSHLREAQTIPLASVLSAHKAEKVTGKLFKG